MTLKVYDSKTHRELRLPKEQFLEMYWFRLSSPARNTINRLTRGDFVSLADLSHNHLTVKAL